MTDHFYRAFEDQFRGSREAIASRLAVYEPFIAAVKSLYPGAPVIDLGCGRGEWLELLSATGFQALGVDLDENMLEACRALNLSTRRADALAVLAELPSDSQAVVSAFHLVEHLPFAQLQTLISQAFRVLKPGGLLILETPNPENVSVATLTFYLDPTHQRPIPPELLRFLPEHYGFARSKILRLQQTPELMAKSAPSLYEVFSGVSPDYAVVAQKRAPLGAETAFEGAFSRDYGLSLHTLATRYDASLFATARELEQRAAQSASDAQQARERAAQAEAASLQAQSLAAQSAATAQQALARAAQAEAAAQQAQGHAAHLSELYRIVLESRSWKLTKPLRDTMEGLRWFARGSKAWLTFAPESRPRRVVRRSLTTTKDWMQRSPRRATLARKALARFPAVRDRLMEVAEPPSPPTGAEASAEAPPALSERARGILAQLNAAAHHHKER